jgi:hypothetical protein
MARITRWHVLHSQEILHRKRRYRHIRVEHCDYLCLRTCLAPPLAFRSTTLQASTQRVITHGTGLRPD